MLESFRGALSLLTAAERRRIGALLVLSAVAAIVQAVAILSIMPFIVLLANPAALETSERLIRAYEWLGAGSYNEFLLAFGVLGLAVLTLGNLFLAVEHWLSTRFLYNLVHRIQLHVLETMLAQPYEYFTANNSGRLGDVLLKQVERVVDGVIGTTIIVLSNVALVVFIVALLLIVSPRTALVTLAGLLVLYLAIFLLLRRRVAAYGRELTLLSGDVFTVAKETLDGVKEIRTRRAERFFAARFARPNRRIARLAVRYSMLSFAPNFLLETLIFAGLVGVALFFVASTANAGVALSLIALYGLAIYRLTPSLKAVFEGMARVHHSADALRAVREHCAAWPAARNHTPPVAASRAPPAVRSPAPAVAAPREAVRLERVSYRYAGSGEAQVRDVDLAIPARSSLCLYGPSGSGKTTLLNLLVGLIFPEQGRVVCDGTGIGPGNVDAWREHVGFCPQEIFLFDGTVESNVAFGVPDAEIDDARVREAARLAGLADFVGERLERGLDAIVGEDGRALSGGQRQRLGIARALYHDPAVVVLDESFTGVDQANKDAILDNLFALPGKTLVFSSHDPAVAARCDRVAMLERGRLVAVGSYGEVTAGSGASAQVTSGPSARQASRKPPATGGSPATR